LETIFASTLGDICTSEGWDHKSRSAVRSRLRQSKVIEGPPIMSGDAHPKRLLDEVQIAALYAGRRYTDARLKPWL